MSCDITLAPRVGVEPTSLVLNQSHQQPPVLTRHHPPPPRKRRPSPSPDFTRLQPPPLVTSVVTSGALRAVDPVYRTSSTSAKPACEPGEPSNSPGPCLLRPLAAGVTSCLGQSARADAEGRQARPDGRDCALNRFQRPGMGQCAGASGGVLCAVDPLTTETRSSRAVNDLQPCHARKQNAEACETGRRV